MKWFLISLFLLPALILGEQDFRGQFHDQFDRGDLSGAETTLAGWEASCREDVELLAAYGSFYGQKAKKGKRVTTAKLSPRNEITLSRPQRVMPGENKDSQTRFDRKTLLKGVRILKKGMELYPRRIDLRFDLARFYQILGEFESQYLILSETLQYLDKNRKNSKWTNNENLPDRPSRFIPDYMQGFETYYFEQQGMDGDEKGYRLAKLTLTYFPNHPAAYNSIAAYFSYINDWEHALKYLLLANQKDPKDSLILNNIGKALVKFDKKKEAGIYFQKVVDLNNDDESVQFARKQLEELPKD